MADKLASKVEQKICDDCILRKNCEYIPDEYELIRCMDKVTEKKTTSPEKENGE